MKKWMLFLVAAMVVSGAVSCKKDLKPEGDGKTPVPELVDLGFSVNGKIIKWASCNLGASTPEEFGDYYAWGELTPKTDYSEETRTYKDDPDRLPLDADVAHKRLGGKWRMPTSAEFEALLLNCEASEVVLSGHVKGVLFVSKINGNSIFLPLAGRMSGKEKRSIGELTEYPSSSKRMDLEGRCHALLTYPKSAGFPYVSIMGTVGRSDGHVIRPVREE